MIPSILLISFGQKFTWYIPVPLFIFWPVLLIVWLIVHGLRILIPSMTQGCDKVLLGIRIFAVARGFSFALASDETKFSVRLW